MATRRLSSTVSSPRRRRPSGTIATPALRIGLGPPPREVLVAEQHPAAARAQHAADGEHERRLAGAVRAEQRRDRVRRARRARPRARPGGRARRRARRSRSEARSLTRPPRCRGRPASRARRAGPRPSGRTRSACRSRAPRSSCSRLETRLMSWSTRIVSAPKVSGIFWITWVRCSVSSSGSPAAGSSSSTSRGLPTTARATSTRRRSRGAEAADLRPRRHRRARRTRSRRARRPRRTTRFAPECSWIIATLSKTESFSIAISVWNVRRSPQRARR